MDNKIDSALCLMNNLMQDIETFYISKNTNMEKISNLWVDLQKSNKLPRGTLTINCESELQELMKQIDLMVNSKKQEWERDLLTTKSRLDVREKEGLLQRATLDHKNKEISQLRIQLEGMEHAQRDLVSQYESQLSQLRSEVQKVKREYEMLHKRHNKHSKDVERNNDVVSSELQDSMSEIHRLTSKLEDYRQKSRDWELQRKTLQKQVEGLESQRKTLTEKCDFMQNQSQGYQSQMDRRRQLLDSTEYMMKTQITQLEGQLDRAKDTINAQDIKIQRLKSSLDEALAAHKKGMDDNEHLLEELRRSNVNNRSLESQESQLQVELQAKEDLLRLVENDQATNSRDIMRMEHTLCEKDEIIRSLGDIRKREATDEVRQLKTSIQELQNEIGSIKRAEKRLHDELSQTRSSAETAQLVIERLQAQLAERDSAAVKSMDNQKLIAEISMLKDKISISSTQHQAEIDGMKAEHSGTTAELHQRNQAVAALSEKAATAEKQLRDETEDKEKKAAGLQVSNAQIEALRLENRHLRQTILHQTQTALEQQEGDAHVRDIQNSYATSVAKLEQENRSLKEEMSTLKSEMSQMDQKFQEKLQSTLLNTESVRQEQRSQDESRLQQVQLDAERQIRALQNRLENNSRLYESEFQLLNSQKHHLEEQLHVREQEINRTIQESDVLGQFVNRVDDVIQSSPRRLGSILNISQPMSLVDSMYDRRTSLSDEFQETDLGDSIADRFLAEEEERAKELERLIDAHIANLRTGTDATIQKYSQ